jgi:hypothetical protein
MKKTIINFIFLLAIIGNTYSCSKTYKPYISTVADDTIYIKWLSINYAAYEGKTVGYFLEKEKIEYKNFHFVDSEFKCLYFVKFVFLRNICLKIYCPVRPKYIKMCDASAPSSWHLEDFKKETIARIDVVRLFPLVKETTIIGK